MFHNISIFLIFCGVYVRQSVAVAVPCDGGKLGGKLRAPRLAYTKQQVQELRIANGMKPNPSEMLRQWVQRGHVVKDETRSVYMKRTEA